LHQPDVVVVAPVFDGDRLIAWCGSAIHEADVGGPTPGGMSYDAASIFDEAIPMAPVRIVEGGSLRRDIEREYLVRSRTPELNRLDLMGQLAANRATTDELLRLCARYGTDALVASLDRLLDAAEDEFRIDCGRYPTAVGGTRRTSSTGRANWRRASSSRCTPSGSRARSRAIVWCSTSATATRRRRVRSTPPSRHS
jgi:N-methylhydantoinase B/oxoprolinase/acetone carboxylase alpha subunit